MDESFLVLLFNIGPVIFVIVSQNYHNYNSTFFFWEGKSLNLEGGAVLPEGVRLLLLLLALRRAPLALHRAPLALRPDREDQVDAFLALTLIQE